MGFITLTFGNKAYGLPAYDFVEISQLCDIDKKNIVSKINIGSSNHHKGIKRIYTPLVLINQKYEEEEGEEEEEKEGEEEEEEEEGEEEEEEEEEKEEGGGGGGGGGEW